MGDFRDGLVAGLHQIAPSDDSECDKIRRILAADLERLRRMFSEKAMHLIGDELAVANRLVDNRERDLTASPGYPLSQEDMRQYACLEIKARIQRMLEADVASGQLAVSEVDGEEVLLLDALVEWAAPRNITIDQDALPGCQSLVQEAYSRLHQRWSSATLAERAATELPDAAAPVIPAAQTGLQQPCPQGIPGKSPKISIGKLAVKAAWQIECEEKRRATAKEVMNLLQLWADNGDEPAVLKTSSREKRSVTWLTSDYQEKPYSLETCEKTLGNWNKTRS